MQGGRLELGGRAAFHVGDFRAFVGDDERALELTEVLGVDAEVGLQGLGHLHALGDVDERAAGEDRGVEGREFVVADGDDLAEPLAEDLRVVAQAFGRSAEDDTEFLELFLHAGVDRFGVELGFDAGEELTFRLRDAEAFEGLLHVVRDFFPRADGLLALGEVVADVLELDVFEVGCGPMRRHRHVLEDLQRLLAELANPFLLALDLGDIVHGRGAEAHAGVEGIVFLVLEVALGAIDFDRFALRLGFVDFSHLV